LREQWFTVRVISSIIESLIIRWPVRVSVIISMGGFLDSIGIHPSRGIRHNARIVFWVPWDRVNMVFCHV